MKPYYEHAGITIYHGDCLEVLPALSASMDSLITDPPFAFTGGISNGSSANISDQFFRHWWRDVAGSIADHLSPAGSGFIWCDWRTAPVFGDGFKPKHQTYDFWRLSQMLFHYREMPGQGQPFRGSVDMIAYIRGPEHKDPPIPNTTHNFISEYWYYGKHDHHPSEKSPTIAQRLIRWCGPRLGVIDPFCGSGTVLVAAKSEKVSAIGIELDEQYCEIAATRLSQDVFDFAGVPA